MMKSLNKFIIALLVVLPFSCDFLNFEDKLDNPNAAGVNNADADLIFNSMQLNFVGFSSSANGLTERIMRQRAMDNGFDYNSAYGSTAGNGMWNQAYSGFLPDYEAFLPIAEANELTAHIGAAKVMKAYIIMSLVDFFGDVPYSEALQGIENPSPKADDSATLYAEAKTLLDEAVAILDPANVSKGFPGADLYYGGSGDNRAQWRMAANSILMKWAMNMGDAGVFNAASAGAINSNADDWDIHAGTNRVNPNSRHPWYNAQYENGDGPYHSNYMMWQMRGAETGTDKSVEDPRLRYFFYRQTDTAEGEDQFTIDCPFRPKPPTYSATDPFCLASNSTTPEVDHDGYWGRDHGDNDGTPPDGHLKTVYGTFPAGGLFDNDSFQNTKTQGTLGGLGEGIWPMMNASHVDFMRAEAALTMGTGGDARALTLSAVQKSIDKVMDFSEGLAGFDTMDSDGNDLKPTAQNITNYINQVAANYDAAADPISVVMAELHIATRGTAQDLWNAYKRTGHPMNMQPVRDGGAGAPFPRIFLYPSNYVDLNSNASQRQFGEKSFWDNSGTSLN